MNDFLHRELDPAFARRARIILEALKLRPGMKILDIGCGRGFYEAAVVSIEPSVHLTALDANSEYLVKAKATVVALGIKHHVKFINGDATKLPFPDNSFDRIICSEVLEHIPNDHAVLCEMRRVLKKGGFAMVSVPYVNYPFLWDPLNWILERLFHRHIPSRIWWLAGIWADHARLYTEQELTSKIKKAQLVPSNMWHATSYCIPCAHFLLYGIGKNLVERGIVAGGFDRFAVGSKPSRLAHLAYQCVYFFDRNNEAKPAGSRFVNLIVKISKP